MKQIWDKGNLKLLRELQLQLDSQCQRSKGNKKLNIGCGQKILDGYINVDKYKPYDEHIDLEKIPYLYKDNTFDEIFCISVLEHTTQPIEVIKEFHRILKPKGELIINVPFYNSLNFHRCLTHKTPFSMNSLDYFDINHTEGTRDNEELDMPKFYMKKYLRGSVIGKYVPYPIRNFIGLFIGNIGESIIFLMRKVKI